MNPESLEELKNCVLGEAFKPAPDLGESEWIADMHHREYKENKAMMEARQRIMAIYQAEEAIIGKTAVYRKKSHKMVDKIFDRWVKLRRKKSPWVKIREVLRSNK